MFMGKQLQAWALIKFTADKTASFILFLPLMMINIMVLIAYALRHSSKLCCLTYTEALYFFI